jgi:hypothetical protein
MTAAELLVIILLYLTFWAVILWIAIRVVKRIIQAITRTVKEEWKGDDKSRH